jgi:alkylglycerol monooxygenase
MQPWVLGAVVLTAIFAITGKVRGRLLMHRLSKPLPLVLLVTTVAASQPLRPWLLVALTFSLLGDIALLFERRGFVLGLASFLVAHVAYLEHLGREAPWRLVELPWLVPLTVGALMILWILWPHLGRLRLPVVVYVAALVLVAFRLCARVSVLGPSATLAIVGALGGLLFVLGDALLALRHFRGTPVPYALELGSYYAAQTLITVALLNAPATP